MYGTGISSHTTCRQKKHLIITLDLFFTKSSTLPWETTIFKAARFPQYELCQVLQILYLRRRKKVIFLASDFCWPHLLDSKHNKISRWCFAVPRLYPSVELIPKGYSISNINHVSNKEKNTHFFAELVMNLSPSDSS